MTEHVKLPKAMLDHLEEQAVELKELKDVILQMGSAIKGYRIIAVVTEPPSGRDAARILSAVQDLVNLTRR